MLPGGAHPPSQAVQERNMVADGGGVGCSQKSGQNRGARWECVNYAWGYSQSECAPGCPGKTKCAGRWGRCTLLLQQRPTPEKKKKKKKKKKKFQPNPTNRVLTRGLLVAVLEHLGASKPNQKARVRIFLVNMKYKAPTRGLLVAVLEHLGASQPSPVIQDRPRQHAHCIRSTN